MKHKSKNLPPHSWELKASKGIWLYEPCGNQKAGIYLWSDKHKLYIRMNWLRSLWFRVRRALS